MKKVFAGFALVCAASVGHANPNLADPTKGYCQNNDPAACGWSTNSAPSRPIYWHFALAFDEDTGAWSSGWGASKKQAIVHAQEGCQKVNVKDEKSIFGRRKSCDKNYTWGGDATNKSPPTVYVKGQTEDGKYRFVVWFGDDFPDKEAAIYACSEKYEFKNCELVGGTR